jgi:hypothetical protein
MKNPSQPSLASLIFPLLRRGGIQGGDEKTHPAEERCQIKSSPTLLYKRRE